MISVYVMYRQISNLKPASAIVIPKQFPATTTMAMTPPTGITTTITANGDASASSISTKGSLDYDLDDGRRYQKLLQCNNNNNKQVI